VLVATGDKWLVLHLFVVATTACARRTRSPTYPAASRPICATVRAQTQGQRRTRRQSRTPIIVSCTDMEMRPQGWTGVNIDPLPIALALWQQSPFKPGQRDTSDQPRQRPPVKPYAVTMGHRQKLAEPRRGTCRAHNARYPHSGDAVVRDPGRRQMVPKSGGVTNHRRRHGRSHLAYPPRSVNLCGSPTQVSCRGASRGRREEG
jgi:hypothetical protein